MRTWWSRWRVATRLARREARRARGRTALVTILVGLPITAAGVALVALASQHATDATFSRWTVGDVAQAHVVLTCPVRLVQDLRVPDGCEYEDDTPEPTVDAAERSLRDRLGPDATLDRYVSTRARVESATQGLDAEYAEVPMAPAVVPVLPLDSGRLPAAAGEAVVAGALADEVGVRPGDPLRVRAPDGSWLTVLVTGVLDRRARAADVVAPPRTVPGVDIASGPATDGRQVEWFVGGAHAVTWADTLALNNVGLLVHSRAVLAHPPSHDQMPFHTEGYAALRSTPAGAATTLAAVAAIGVTETALLIGPAFAVGAHRARRSLGLLAAAGADRAHLRRTVLATGLVVGLVAAGLGASLGVAAGCALVAWTPGWIFPNVTVPWGAALGLVALGTALTLGASALPARAASRLDVVAALRGRSAAAPLHRRTPALGLAVLALGLAGSIAGATRSDSRLVVAGMVGALLGVVSCAGGVLTLAGRAAGRLPTTPRLALRDAVRHRSRSAPALAAVIASVAGALAGGTHLLASLEHQRSGWAPSATPGMVSIAVDPAGLEPDELSAAVARALDAAGQEAPLDGAAPLRVLAPAPDVAAATVPGTPRPGQLGSPVVYVDPEIPEANACPLALLTRDATDAEVSESADDPRCAVDGESTSLALTAGWNEVLVDDGSALRTTRLPGADEAAEALADGAAVVTDAAALWPDGTVHLRIDVQDPRDGASAAGGELVLPGHVLDSRSLALRTILPLSAEAQLRDAGVAAVAVGALARPAEPWTHAQESAARNAVDTAVGTAEFQVLMSRPFAATPDPVELVFVVLALLVALAATWIAIGLTAFDQRADLATLAAIGATPSLRRRLAGAHALVLSGLGTCLGAAVGAALGAALTLAERGAGSITDPRWTVVVPWPQLAAVVVGLPLVAGAVAALATPTTPPATRRVAD